MIFQDGLGVAIRSEGVGITHVKGSISGAKTVFARFYAQDEDISLQDRLTAAHSLVIDFIRERRIGSTDVFIGIPDDHVMFRIIEFPLVIKENLRSTLTYEMEKYVPIPVADIYFDFTVIEENKANNRLKVLLSVVKKQEFDPYLLFCRNLDTGVSSVEPLKVATLNGLLYLGGEVISGETVQLFKDDAHAISLFKSLDSSRRLKVNIPSFEELPGFALAAKGIAKFPLSANLLPHEDRKRPSRLKYFILFGLMTIVLISALTWGGSALLRQRLALRSLEKEIERLKVEVDESEAARRRLEKVTRKLEILGNIRQNRLAAIDVLRELSQLIPDSAWIRDFSLKNDTLTIDGSAQKASDLIPLLESSPLFKDAVFLSAITRENDGKERFRIGLKLTSRE